MVAHLDLTTARPLDAQLYYISIRRWVLTAEQSGFCSLKWLDMEVVGNLKQLYAVRNNSSIFCKVENNSFADY